MTTDIERCCVEAVPGYREISAAVHAIGDRIDQLPAGTADQLRAQLLADVADRIATGGALPQDLGRQVEDLGAVVAERTALGDLLRYLEQRREASMRSIVGADAALGVLHRALVGVLGEVAELDGALGDVTSEASARAAGGEMPNRWARLVELVDAVDDIRRLQLQWTDRVVPSLVPSVVEAGLIVDPTKHVAKWEQLPSGHFAPIGVWPSPTPGVGVWPTADRPAFLRWLAVGPAEAWVPSIGELRQAAAALREAGGLRQLGYDPSRPLTDYAPREEPVRG